MVRISQVRLHPFGRAFVTDFRCRHEVPARSSILSASVQSNHHCNSRTKRRPGTNSQFILTQAQSISAPSFSVEANHHILSCALNEPRLEAMWTQTPVLLVDSRCSIKSQPDDLTLPPEHPNWSGAWFLEYCVPKCTLIVGKLQLINGWPSILLQNQNIAKELLPFLNPRFDKVEQANR